MYESGGLALNGIDDAGVAVAGRHHGDSCREIEESVAVNVFDDRSLTPSRNKRVSAGI
jgi:hypothetical protein